MTQKIYFSPIASKTVDVKLQAIMEAIELELDEKDDLDIRNTQDKNDLNLENTQDAPYA